MPLSKTLTVTGNGTTAAQSSVWLLDSWVSPQNIGVGISFSGSVTVSVQGAYDDFGPQWDLTANPPTWYNLTNLTSVSSATNGSISGGPFTMLRLNTSAGTGTATAKFIQSYVGQTV